MSQRTWLKLTPRTPLEVPSSYTSFMRSRGSSAAVSASAAPRSKKLQRSSWQTSCSCSAEGRPQGGTDAVVKGTPALLTTICGRNWFVPGFLAWRSRPAATGKRSSTLSNALGHSCGDAPTSGTRRATSTGAEPTKPLSPNQSGTGWSSTPAASPARTTQRRPAFTCPIHCVTFGPAPGMRA